MHGLPNVAHVEPVRNQLKHAECVCKLCHGRQLTSRGAGPLSTTIEQTYEVRALLDSGASADRSSHDGATLLHFAAYLGLTACVRKLCKTSVTIDTMTDRNATALHYASLRGHVDCVRTLCEAGAMVEQVADDGMTPLHLAATHGHALCVQVLCEASTMIDQATSHGYRAIDAAITWDQAECVRVLLDAGASMTANKGCITLLHSACILGSNSCAHVLSSHGARDSLAIEAATERGEIGLANWLTRAHAWTPLHHLEVLTPARTLALLRGGADLNTGTPSPLERARVVPGEASALVLRSGERWSPETHHLFPAVIRARALAILRLGYLLAWSPRYAGEAAGLVDVWVGFVMPHIVERC